MILNSKSLPFLLFHALLMKLYSIVLHECIKIQLDERSSPHLVKEPTQLLNLIFNMCHIDGHQLLKYQPSESLTYSVFHKSIPPWYFARNQSNHRNWMQSMIPKNIWDIWTGMRQKKNFFLNFEYLNFVVSKKVNFSDPPIPNIFSPKFQETVPG